MMSIFKKAYFPLALIAIFWALITMVKLRYNGLVFGFDYGNYQPDGAHYTYRTLTFLGKSPSEASGEVAQWYSNHAFKMSNLNADSLIPSNNPVWGLVSSRVLYPLLSIPFVYLLGIPGMLVIPALSLLIMMIAIYFLGSHYNHSKLGLILAIGITLSPTILRWMIVNCTDSLLAGLFSIVVLVLTKTSHLRQLIFLVLLCGLTSATRICLPIWISISFIFWLKKNRKSSVLLFICSFLFSLPALLTQPKNAILPGAGNIGFFPKLLVIPMSFIKIAFYEILELIVLDRILLIFLGISLYYGLTNLHRNSTRFFLATLLSVWALAAINGTVGTNFRYELPLIPFASWLLFDNYNRREINLNVEK